jgi:uncharacterized protein YecA (UPF0149 family)
MSKLSFNAINSLMGKDLTPVQKQMRSKVKLSRPNPRHVNKSPGNNDPCYCNSGLKFKNCCK